MAGSQRRGLRLAAATSGAAAMWRRRAATYSGARGCTVANGRWGCEERAHTARRFSAGLSIGSGLSRGLCACMRVTVVRPRGPGCDAITHHPKQSSSEGGVHPGQRRNEEAVRVASLRHTRGKRASPHRERIAFQRVSFVHAEPLRRPCRTAVRRDGASRTASIAAKAWALAATDEAPTS